MSSLDYDYNYNSQVNLNYDYDYNGGDDFVDPVRSDDRGQEIDLGKHFNFTYSNVEPTPWDARKLFINLVSYKFTYSIFLHLQYNFSYMF